MSEHPKLCRAIEYLVDDHGPILGRTRLVKLLYLADLRWADERGAGRGYTEARYYRWNHGPFAREILDAIDWMNGVEILETVADNPVGVEYRYVSGRRTRLRPVTLNPEFKRYLDEVAEEWGDVSLAEILAHVYEMPVFKNAGHGDSILE